MNSVLSLRRTALGRTYGSFHNRDHVLAMEPGVPPFVRLSASGLDHDRKDKGRGRRKSVRGQVETKTEKEFDESLFGKSAIPGRDLQHPEDLITCRLAARRWKGKLFLLRSSYHPLAATVHPLFAGSIRQRSSQVRGTKKMYQRDGGPELTTDIPNTAPETC